MSRIDNITLQRIQNLHPALRVDAEKAYREASELLTGNAILRFAYTIRTIAEQDELYSRGRTKLFDAKGNRLGIVTFARGGDSWHNYGLAWDIVLLVDTNGDGRFNAASWNTTADFDKDGKADWAEVSDLFTQKYGMEVLFKNGKRWDLPHFQKRFGLTIAEAKRRHLAKDFIPGTQFIRI
jgi:peptidoglycan LD-endopeptidase CwlK